jgi:N-acetylmuramoyl-L-alanine amidase
VRVRQHKSPHYSSRDGKRPTIVVIHGDAGKSDLGTVSWLAHPASKVSYHYLIGRDGTVYQFVPEEENAWHAGLSKFHGEEVGKSVNRMSIGLAFANDGTGKEAYTEAQYEAGGELLADICRRHGIPLHRVRAHSEVSPGRKSDPWKWFDWDRFYCAFGKFTRAAEEV